MPRGSSLKRQLAVIVGSAMLLAGSLAVPATAGAAGPGASGAARPGSQVIDRGSVDARAAARSAGGVTRGAPPRVLRLDRAPGSLKEGSPALLAGSGAPTARIVDSTPKVTTEFAGIGNIADGLDTEPPDPWVAVNSTHVVQATNAMVRMYNRSGTTLLSVPTWALFGFTPDMFDADPRIIWDAAHSRWVGVLLGFAESGGLVQYASLTLAVSETADPTGAWDLTEFAYYDTDGVTPTLPDYPGIASSSDKIAITANEFDQTETTYLGASTLVVRWSEILANTPLNTPVWTFADPTIFTIRPAIVQGTTSDIHLIAEDGGATPDVLYARLSGTSPADPVWQNLAGTVLPFCLTNEPRQPGVPATITRAVDERPTDAVWRSNTLAFVSTCSVGGDNYVRVTRLNTTSATTTVPPSMVGDDLFGNVGTDAFMGGVGYTRDGTLVLSYTQSSPTEYASQFLASLTGGVWYGGGLVKAGEGTYLGTRWGDYVGVATDPVGTGAVWVANQYADEYGSWSTRVIRVVVDSLAPIVSGPTQALVTGSQITGYQLPVKVAWTASDTGSGIASSRLSVDAFGTGLASSGSTGTATSVTRNHFWRPYSSAGDYSYQYAAAAVDAYGNVSTTVLGADLSPLVYQQTNGVTYTGTWKTSSSSAYLGGSVRYSTSAGASASFRTSGRSFGFVTTKASGRGKVKVYVDGVLKGTVTLTSSATKYRTLAYTITFSSSATHTIKLVVASGRVDLDGFVVLK